MSRQEATQIMRETNELYLKLSKPQREDLGMLEYAKGGSINAKYLNSISNEKREMILSNIAKHYGTSISKIKDEVNDEEAEKLYEYIANDNKLRMEVYNSMEKNYAKGGKVKEIKLEIEKLKKENPEGFKAEIKSLQARLEHIKSTGEDIYPYAKGGKVEKKENNEMIMGGIAGILLGIFLNK